MNQDEIETKGEDTGSEGSASCTGMGSMMQKCCPCGAGCKCPMFCVFLMGGVMLIAVAGWVLGVIAFFRTL